MLKCVGTRRKRVQRRGQHGDIALDILDAALPKWRAGGEEGVRHRFDGGQGAPARRKVGQIGSEMGEGHLMERSGARHAVDTPSGTTRERGGDGTTGRAGRPDDKSDLIRHRGQTPLDGDACSYRQYQDPG